MKRDLFSEGNGYAGSNEVLRKSSRLQARAINKKAKKREKCSEALRLSRPPPPLNNCSNWVYAD